MDQSTDSPPIETIQCVTVLPGSAMATVTTVTVDVFPFKGNAEDLVFDYGTEDWVPVPVDLPDVVVVAEPLQLAVYKRRWFMLFVVAFLNLSNSCMFINFAPVTNATASFFGNIDSDWVDLFSLVFFVTTIPFMFFAMWVTNKKGFRTGIQCGCALQFTGSLVRIFGTAGFVPSPAQYPVTLVGQTITSLAQSFGLALPTKVSEVWFPESQRSFSTALCSLGNPLGFLLANLISPLIVNSGNDIPVMNELFCSLGMTAGLVGLLVFESKPPLPPSNTGSKLVNNVRHTTYCADLREIFVNKDYVIVMLSFGCGTGLINSFGTMMGQMMCTFGYSDDVAGLSAALSVVGGVCGVAILSFIAGKTKKLEEIIIIGFSISITLTITFVMIFSIRNIEAIIITVTILLGFMAIGLYPIALEVGVECTYPVDESLSTGVIVIAGQALSAVFLLVMAGFAQTPSAYDQAHQVCSVEGAPQSYDMTYPALFLVGVVAIITMILAMIFRPKYKRREAERLKLAMSATSVITARKPQSTVDVF